MCVHACVHGCVSTCLRACMLACMYAWLCAKHWMHSDRVVIRGGWDVGRYGAGYIKLIT